MLFTMQTAMPIAFNRMHALLAFDRAPLMFDPWIGRICFSISRSGAFTFSPFDLVPLLFDPSIGCLCFSIPRSCAFACRLLDRMPLLFDPSIGCFSFAAPLSSAFALLSLHGVHLIFVPLNGGRTTRPHQTQAGPHGPSKRRQDHMTTANAGRTT